MRGRVLAIDAELGAAILRCADRDVRVPDAPRGWRAGDLVDGDEVVRAYAGAAYPSVGSEVMRPAAGATREPRRAARVRWPRCARCSPRALFLEVETPLLVPTAGLEIHLDAVPAGDGSPDHVARVPDEAVARGRPRANLPGLQVFSRERGRPAPRERVPDDRVRAARSPGSTRSSPTTSSSSCSPCAWRLRPPSKSGRRDRCDAAVASDHGPRRDARLRRRRRAR